MLITETKIVKDEFDNYLKLTIVKGCDCDYNMSCDCKYDTTCVEITKLEAVQFLEEQVEDLNEELVGLKLDVLKKTRQIEEKLKVVESVKEELRKEEKKR